MKHLYALYGTEQSTTMPYNPHGNAQCEQFNCTMMGLLTSLSKEQKDKWPLHIPSLVFVYNAMPHSTIGYQAYELMLAAKHPPSVMRGSGWQIMMIIIRRASVNG